MTTTTLPGKAQSAFDDVLHREWTDISSELYRTYIFSDSVRLTIDTPLRLLVSESGGHRVFSAESGGKCYYISPNWIAIEWKVAEGKPHFVK
jgi:hypothetical protein